MVSKAMRKLLVRLFSILLLVSSCTTTRIATLTTTENEKIELFTTKLPQREYIEIYYIQTDGGIFHTPQKLLDGLKTKAIELNADAIIEIKHDFQAWYPIASGIAVKYK